MGRLQTHVRTRSTLDVPVALGLCGEVNWPRRPAGLYQTQLNCTQVPARRPVPARHTRVYMCWLADPPPSSMQLN